MRRPAGDLSAGSGPQSTGGANRVFDVSIATAEPDSRTAARFPFDNTYARLPRRFHARLDPAPVAAPALVRVNRPVLREYIVSEAMAALGIPTTRSLAAVTTGEIVMRETALPGAVLTRVASSHVRVGTFEYFAARGDAEAVQRLAAT